MDKSLAQIEKKIQALRIQAEKARQREMVDVIAKIKPAIAAYGISIEDLFGSTASRGAGSTRTSDKKSASAAAKYSDGAGHSWSGRGPRPQWLRTALAAGQPLEQFLTGAKKGSAAVKTKPQPKSKSKANGAAQFGDGTNVWSGRGPRPRWLKESLAAGKTLDQLRLQ